MINTDGWSATKKLKHSLLRRAFNENRGAEVILLIQWRSAWVRHNAEKDAETLKTFEARNEGQPRAIRALNLIEEQNGSDRVYKLTPEKTAPSNTKDLFRMLAETPLEQRILYREKPAGMPAEMARVPETEQITHTDRMRDFLTRAPASAFFSDVYDPMDGLVDHEDADYADGKITRGMKTAYDMACADEAKFRQTHGLFTDASPRQPAPKPH